MSTDERKIQLGVEVDATGARAGFDQVAQGAEKMAQAVGQAGAKAGAGMDKLGDAGEGAAKKLTAGEKSIAASIQRTTAVLEAGERGSVKYFEALARLRGEGVDNLRPYLDKLQAAKAAQDAANASLGNMGISAKQTAAALRGVPAQFTDIFTSLQGGQAPLTVLLQQGGQLKDMFGGVGAAARALGGYVLGLVNPYTVAAAAAGGLYLAYEAGRQEAAAYSNALIQTGNAAGTTVGQLNAVASAVDAIAGTQGRAAEVLTQLVRGGVVGRVALEEMTAAAIMFERAGGQAAEETVKQFVELGKDPVKAVLKLNESMNFLTTSTYEQIKSLVEQGRTTEAANLAQTTLADTLKDRTAGMVQNLGLVERGWRGIKDAVAEAWDSIKSIGRDVGSEGQLTAARTAADVLQQQIDSRRGRGLATGDLERQLAAANQLIQTKQEEVRLIARAAAAEGERVRIQKEGVAASDAVGKAQEKGLSKQEQMNKALEEYRANIDRLRAANPESALLNPERVAAGEKAIRDQFKETASARLSAEDSQIAAIRAKLATEDEALRRLKLYGLEADKMTEGEREVLRLQEQITLATNAKTKASLQAQLAVAKEVAARQASIAAIREGLKWEDELAKRRVKSYADAVRGEEAVAAQREREVLALEKQVQRLEDEEKAAIIAAAGNVSLAQAVEMVGLARVKEAQAQALANQADGDTLLKLQREIEARERIIVLMGSKEGREASAKAAKDAQAEWVRAAQEIERSLTDALMRGFESGKGFAENLRDTVVNMFKTMVLRPVISAIVNPVAAALTGALGVPAAASAATTASGALSGIGSLGSIGSALGGFGTAAGYGAQALFAGNGLGALSGGMSMIGAGSFAQGAGMVAGVLGPVVAGVTLLSSLIKSTKTPGEQHLGGYYSSRGLDASMANALALTNGGGDGGYARDLIKREDAGLKAFTQQTVDGVLAAATGSAKALGLDIALGIDAGFAANLNGKGKNKNAFGYAQIFADGELAGEYSNRELGSDVTAAGTKFASDLADAAADIILAGSDFKRTGETSAQTLARLGGSLTAVNASFDLLGVEMLETSLKGGDMASALADVFGGVEQFQQATATFYSQFYSDSEKFATQQRLLRQGFDELGIAMPRSTRDFRALVEAQDLTTEAGRDMYAQLMALAPAFSEVSKAVEGAFDSISRTTASSVRDIQLSLLDDKEKYQFLDAEIESLITKLSEATLPSEIERLFGQINANTTQAYGLLDPAQQKNAAADFINALYEAEAIAQSRLSVTGQQATAIDRQVEAVQVHMEAAKLQREAATAMSEAATEMRLAAQRMQEAANTPVVLKSSSGTVVGGREVMVA